MVFVRVVFVGVRDCVGKEQIGAACTLTPFIAVTLNNASDKG